MAWKVGFKRNTTMKERKHKSCQVLKVVVLPISDPEVNFTRVKLIYFILTFREFFILFRNRGKPYENMGPTSRPKHSKTI